MSYVTKAKYPPTNWERLGKNRNSQRHLLLCHYSNSHCVLILHLLLNSLSTHPASWFSYWYVWKCWHSQNTILSLLLVILSSPHCLLLIFHTYHFLWALWWSVAASLLGTTTPCWMFCHRNSNPFPIRFRVAWSNPGYVKVMTEAGVAKRLDRQWQWVVFWANDNHARICISANILDTNEYWCKTIKYLLNYRALHYQDKWLQISICKSSLHYYVEILWIFFI